MNDMVRERLIALTKKYRHEPLLAVAASKHILVAPEEDRAELLTTFLLYYKFENNPDAVPYESSGANPVEIRHNIRRHSDEFNAMYNVAILAQKIDGGSRSFMEIWTEKLKGLSPSSATFMIVLACEDDRFPVLTEQKPLLPQEYKVIKSDVDKQVIYEVEHIFNQSGQTLSQMADALLQLMDSKETEEERLVMLSHALTLQIMFTN